MIESLMSQSWPAVVASLIAGALSALLTYRVSMRREDASAEARVREELKSLLKEERGAHSDCLQEVREMRVELTEARVSAARWESRCETIERMVQGLHERLITGYLGAPEKPLAGPSAKP